MNEVSTAQRQLPDNLPDLTKFVLIGREKLNAVRAEIRAIKAVGLATEVYQQKLEEAQEVAEAVLDAEVKIGELTSSLEKSKGGRPSETHVNSDTSFSTKAEQLEEIGVDRNQASRFERMARHPETVEKAKAEARAEGRIVTRQDVLNRIVVPMPRTRTIADIKKQARQEHVEFEQKKKENVVLFEDIKKDKENVEMINLDTLITIRKIISSIGTVMIIPKAELISLRDNLDEDEKNDLFRSLNNSMKLLDRLYIDLGGM